MDSKQKNLSERARTTQKSKHEIYNPGGPPVYGRVTALVAEHLNRGEQVKGLRLWYRCSSCSRIVRVGKETEHNKIFHKIVQCSQCQKNVDSFEFLKHQRENCPKLKMFCEYCSVDTTKEDLPNHYDSCICAKRDKNAQVYANFTPLKNIQFPEPISTDLRNITSKMSKIAIGDTFTVKQLKTLNKPLGYNAMEFDSNGMGHEGKEPINGILERRLQKQLKEHKQVLCRYLVKKIKSPKESIQHLLQRYFLNRNTEDMLGNLMVSPVAQAGGIPALKVQAGPSRSGEPPSTSSFEVKKYLRNIHDITANLCRQDAREFAEYRRKQCIVKNVIKLKARLERRRIVEDQTYVINQAVELEGHRDKIALIPPEVRPKFFEEVKSTRPIWPDLGIMPDETENSAYALNSTEQANENGNDRAARIMFGSAAKDSDEAPSRNKLGWFSY